MNQNLNLQVGVKTFIYNKEGKILILKRNSEKYPTINKHWDIPGGRIDNKYDLITNLNREVLEETGLKIKNPTLITAQDIFESGFRVIRLTYISFATSSRVMLSDEHTEYKWISLKELLRLKGFDKYIEQAIKACLPGIAKQIVQDKKCVSRIKDIIKQALNSKRQNLVLVKGH